MRRIKAAAEKLISLVCLAALIIIAPSAAAAPPEELEPSYEEELLQERWKVEMENILRLFVDWSEYNGVYDGKGLFELRAKRRLRGRRHGGSAHRLAGNRSWHYG